METYLRIQTFSHGKHCTPVTKCIRLMLFNEVMHFYSKTHVKKPTNTLSGRNSEPSLMLSRVICSFCCVPNGERKLSRI